MAYEGQGDEERDEIFAEKGISTSCLSHQNTLVGIANK